MTASSGNDTRLSSATRRDVLKWLLGFSFVSTIAGVIVPIIGYLWPPTQNGPAYAGPTLVGDAVDFPVSSGKVIPVEDKPVIIVDTSAGGIKAFSAICTHLGCVVGWKSSQGIIECPCHDGRFNPLNGAVISGPPPRPLPSYEIVVQNDKVYVGRPQGEIYGA